MSSCLACPERHSAYASWTCGHCQDAVAERVAPELWRALFWRRLIQAGYPPDNQGLGFWDLWLLAMIEELFDERKRKPVA